MALTSRFALVLNKRILEPPKPSFPTTVMCNTSNKNPPKILVASKSLHYFNTCEGNALTCYEHGLIGFEHGLLPQPFLILTLTHHYGPKKFIVSAPKGERPRKRCVFRRNVAEQLNYGVKGLKR